LITGWPLLLLLSYLFAAGCAALTTQNARLSIILQTLIALSQVGIVMALLWQVSNPDFAAYDWHYHFATGLDWLWRVDGLAMYLLVSSTSLWWVLLAYSLGSWHHTATMPPLVSLNLSMAVMTSTLLAANWFSFFSSYLLLSLCSFSVLQSIASTQRFSRLFWRYSVISDAVLLLAIIGLMSLLGVQSFAPDGMLQAIAVDEHHFALTGIFCLFIFGFASKVALIPLHQWLLHNAHANLLVLVFLVTLSLSKAALLGLLRLIYEVYNLPDMPLLSEVALNLLNLMAATTLLYSAVKALQQTLLSQRVAYLLINQLAVIVLSISLVNQFGLVATLLHWSYQTLLGMSLLLCIANLSTCLQVHSVSDLQGIGRHLPFTFGALSVVSLGLIGIPPTIGFIGQWFLARAVLAAGDMWLLGILALNSLLMASALLPLFYQAWFKPSQHKALAAIPIALSWPPFILASLSLLLGLLALAPFSPLQWVQQLATVFYSTAQVFSNTAIAVPL